MESVEVVKEQRTTRVANGEKEGEGLGGRKEGNERSCTRSSGMRSRVKRMGMSRESRE